MIWAAFALMTAVAVLGVLVPLWRRRSGREGRARAIEFHKAQLVEIDRDVARGLLPAAEAAGARAEAARRLIAASEGAKISARQDDGRESFRTRAAALAIVTIVPAVAFGFYVKLGSPRLPDQPILARVANPAPADDLGAALAKIEAHLRADPNDGRGFKVIAPVYMRLGRFEEAAKAYAAVLRVLGEDASTLADYGEALTAAAQGTVTAPARAAFEQALAKQGDMARARYYVGLAAEQGGDKSKAIELYQQLIHDAPIDAPWLPMVRSRLASLTGAAAPATPGGEAAAAIAALDPSAQQTAIRGMVEGLAARLAQNGADGPGWLRLIRAYGILHETEKAKDALAQARKAMAGNEAVTHDLDALAHQFGLGS